MPDDVRLAFANRQWRGRPHAAGIPIAQVDHFAGRIADGVVGPRRQTVLMTVHRPRVTAARFGDLKPEIDRVADYVGPRRGRPLLGAKQGDVFTSALMKAAETVEETEFGRSNGGLGISLRSEPRYQQRRQRFLRAWPFELILEAATLRDNHHARNGVQQDAIRVGYLIGATQINAAGFALQRLQP